MSNDDEPMMLRYSSSENPAFQGEIESNVTRAEWDAMDPGQQVEVLTDALFVLVDDIGPVDE